MQKIMIYAPTAHNRSVCVPGGETRGMYHTGEPGGENTGRDTRHGVWRDNHE
jgi:hypothetical protein